MIHIVSTFSISKNHSAWDLERNKELETSLGNNVNSIHIEKIHLFVDDHEALQKLQLLFPDSEKLHVIEVGKKPLYTDFFHYILHHLPNNICMIMNADIFLHDCDVTLIGKLKEDKIMYALTRHEHDMSCPLVDQYEGTHDAYIFHSKYATQKLINPHSYFYQNIPGIETRVIKSFCEDGFQVLNPCKQIQIVHLHQSNIQRNGGWIGLHQIGDDKFMKQNCWYVPPTTL